METPKLRFSIALSHKNIYLSSLRKLEMIKKKNISMALMFTMMALGSQANGGVTVQDDSETIKRLTAEVKAQYAPDKRTAWFELEEENNKGTFEIETTVPEAKTAFETLLKESGSQAKVNFRVLPDETVGDTRHAVVRLSVVDIRYTPANQAEMVTQALLGTPVDLLKKRGGYFLVRTPEGYIAWLKDSSLATMDAASYSVWTSANKLMFTEDFGHAYTEPNKNSLRVSDLVMGNIVKLDQSNVIKGSDQTDFYAVSYPDGRKAFIPSNQSIPYAQWLADTELTAENVLRVAKTMVGVPYLWGGTSVKGVDCSGLTKTAFYMSGLVIPRDASQQVNSGLDIPILDADQKVDREKALATLQPADLLFFAERKGQTDNPRVTHVGIYIGNGEFIHASGLVRINSLFADAENFDAHQARTIVSAKRYVGQSGNGLDKLEDHPAYAVK